ncbi:MAG: transposase [Chlorobiaceae bacterium]|nr:transposase [Chlorobiaceae bacterium]
MIDILRKRLERYSASDAKQAEQALKEILQEVSLYGLWRADFFEVAAFQGVTCLRILHGLPRFSEDLDFILRTPDKKFRWNPYFETLDHAREVIGLWQKDYNSIRPHSSLGKLTPEEFQVQQKDFFQEMVVS